MTLRTRACAFFIVFIAIISLPPYFVLEANDEGEWDAGVQVEERSWGRYSRETRDAIDELPDTRTEFLPIPVAGVSVSSLTRNFGDSRGGGTRTHEGLDIMAPAGTPVLSPTEAVVTRVGDGSSAGIYIRTVGPGSETFVYMHLSSVADGIDEGVKVAVGQVIGYVGNTGNASGGAPHLHFEIRKDGATDPYPRLTLTAIPTSSTKTGLLYRSLTLGSQGEDVRALQKYLNERGYLVAKTGPGSPGKESDYFGSLTRIALARFQADNDISPAAGYFGPKTLAYLNPR